MYNLIKDIATITLIKFPIFSKLINVSEVCICDYVNTSQIKGSDIIEVDIGIGTLFINIANDEILYKFVPSKKLEKKLVKTIVDGKSPIIDKVENKLNNKILNTYKELL